MLERRREFGVNLQRSRIILVLIWTLLFVSTLITWNTLGHRSYGASRRDMEAGEIYVSWFNAITFARETLRIRYEASAGPIDIYVVTQDSYNRTSGEIPESFLLHHHGNSTQLRLDGYLPFLYYVVISEVDQTVYIQSWVISPETRIAEMLVYPMTILLIIVSVISIVWYARSFRRISLHLIT